MIEISLIDLLSLIIGPLVGVVAGVILASITDYFNHRPKVKVELKDGNFNYFVDYQDDQGFIVRKVCESQDGEYFILNLQVDIYNYGRGNTAIKEVLIETRVNRREKIYLQPSMNVKGQDNTDYSFNLPSRTIQTINLNLKLQKDEENEHYFSDQVTYSPEDIRRLLFTVLIENINRKTYKLRVEPLSILAAEH